MRLSLTGPVATLIERDNDVPAWPVLFAEAQAAEQLMLAVTGIGARTLTTEEACA